MTPPTAEYATVQNTSIKT